MPKQTEIEKQIPRLYRRSALNLLMFGYVRGVRATLATVTILEAIYMFMETFDLDHDEYNSQSALTTFNRMQNEFLNN